VPLTAKTIEVSAAGASGAAIGERRAWLTPARLHAVEADYADGQPAAATLALISRGRTILELANQNADRTVHPRVPVQDATGADIPDEFERPLLSDAESVVAISQANPADPAVIVRLYVEY
jgi:hypothetical protein